MERKFTRSATIVIPRSKKALLVSKLCQYRAPTHAKASQELSDHVSGWFLRLNLRSHQRPSHSEEIKIRFPCTQPPRRITISPTRVYNFGTLSKHSEFLLSERALSRRGDVPRRFLAPAPAIYIRSTMKPWSDSEQYIHEAYVRAVCTSAAAPLQKHCQLHCFGARACKIKVSGASFLHQTKGFVCLYITRDTWIMHEGGSVKLCVFCLWRIDFQLKI
jgi:hypothetical protein